MGTHSILLSTNLWLQSNVSIQRVQWVWLFDDLLHELLICQSLLPILGDKHLFVLVRDLGLDTLKSGIEQGIQERIAELVAILGRQHAIALRVILNIANGSNIDKQPIIHIDPACVNDVVLVKAVLPPADVVGVHLELEVAALRDGRVLVVPGGHVVVGGEEVDAVLGDLHVGVRVPGERLFVPPPAEEGAVHEPGLDAEVAEGGEVGLDQDLDCLALGCCVEWFCGEAGVVVD